MNQDELNKIIAAHRQWLSGNGGERADLSYADLSYADLSYADLSYAVLSSAVLSYADLSYAVLSSAVLSYADLSYADLSYADLSSADLRTTLNFVLLPVQDPRGHSFPYAVWHGTQWMIRSGCKCLSIADAIAYVSSDSFSGEPWLRDAYLHAFGWLTAWAAVRCELGAQ